MVYHIAFVTDYEHHRRKDMTEKSQSETDIRRKSQRPRAQEDTILDPSEAQTGCKQKWLPSDVRLEMFQEFSTLQTLPPPFFVMLPS